MPATASTKSSCKKRAAEVAKEPPQPTDTKEAAKKRGWDEIQSLFDDKKKKKKAVAETTTTAKKKHQQHHNRGGNFSSTVAHRTPASERGGDWVDDGLGGVYNAEGYTGRVEEGVRVFKAHIIQQSPGAGNTELCPFDCKCCYM